MGCQQRGITELHTKACNRPHACSLYYNHTDQKKKRANNKAPRSHEHPEVEIVPYEKYIFFQLPPKIEQKQLKNNKIFCPP